MLRVMIGIEAYMQASSSAFVIRMYLPEGVPEGIRIVERSNWVGQAVICPHSRFTSVRERPEAESAGVYVLLGQEEENDLPMAYIGEADPLIDRLLQHYRNKDWWTSVVFFVSKDRQLNKAHIQYLEATVTIAGLPFRGPQILEQLLDGSAKRWRIRDVRCLVGIRNRSRCTAGFCLTLGRSKIGPGDKIARIVRMCRDGSHADRRTNPVTEVLHLIPSFASARAATARRSVAPAALRKPHKLATA
jgi:hypothetical protein